jgi:hypothetical protein
MTRATDTDRAGRLRTAALGHAARGWHVFPLVPDDKRPAVKEWETRATTDPARIVRAWSAGPYGIGIACGPSGLVVVDLDRPKPGQQPPPAWAMPGVVDGGDVLAVLCESEDQPLPVDTYTVRTASAGLHLYYAPPPGQTFRNTTGRLGWLIDTRAAGGYVVAAGSTAGGRPYAVQHDQAPAVLPAWLAERLTEPATPAAPAAVVSGSGRDTSAYARAALRGELDRVLVAAEGTRNHTLNAAAYNLGQLVAAGHLARELAEEALILAGHGAGLPLREAAATVRSGLRAGAQHPRPQPPAADNRPDLFPPAPTDPASAREDGTAA